MLYAPVRGNLTGRRLLRKDLKKLRQREPWESVEKGCSMRRERERDIPCRDLRLPWVWCAEEPSSFCEVREVRAAGEKSEA